MIKAEKFAGANRGGIRLRRHRGICQMIEGYRADPLMHLCIIPNLIIIYLFTSLWHMFYNSERIYELN